MALARLWLRRLLSAAPNRQATITQLNKWGFLLTRDGVIPNDAFDYYWFRHGPVFMDEPLLAMEATAKTVTVAHPQLGGYEATLITLVGPALDDAETRAIRQAIKPYLGRKTDDLAHLCYDGEAPFVIQEPLRWLILPIAEEPGSIRPGQETTVLDALADVQAAYPFEEAPMLQEFTADMEEAILVLTLMLRHSDNAGLAGLAKPVLMGLWGSIACAIRLDTENGRFPDRVAEWRQQYRQERDSLRGKVKAAWPAVRKALAAAAPPAEGSPSARVVHAHLDRTT